MPHVIVKLHSGRSEQQKSKLAELITQAVMTGARCAEHQTVTEGTDATVALATIDQGGPTGEFHDRTGRIAY